MENDAPAGPVISRESDREWETWSEEQVAERGLVFWKTLISSDVVPSKRLTMGVARMPPGGTLRAHRHSQDEIYLVLEGTGTVRVGADARSIEAGSAVFIPGDAVHSCENTGTSDLRIAYVFPADSFDDVEYIFGETGD